MLDKEEPHEPYELVNTHGDPTLLLVCDHASNHVPADYDNLGLPQEQLDRHIGYDIGAEALTRKLCELMDAPAALSRFSRLLIDPNRGEDDPTLVMRISDGAIIPGNRHADAAEIERRLDRFYRPYHAAVDRLIDGMEAPLADRRGLRDMPVVLSIHSFTPYWKGRTRPWEIGVLYSDEDTRLAAPLLRRLRRVRDLVVGDNQPYRGSMTGDSMHKHGIRRGLPHAVVEIRQDLIDNPEGVDRIAGLMRNIMAGVLADMQDRKEHTTASVHRLRA